MHVIRGSLYSPGEVGGARVSTLVSQQIRFSLAGGSARRVALNETRERLIRTQWIKSPQPLVVVDGVLVERGEEFMTNLNPDNIARIEVVKGDAAVTMWGDRAANGVIQIFTKSATGVSARRESN